MDPKLQTEEERKRNAPPQTHTREEKAPTEIRDTVAGEPAVDHDRLREDNELRKKLAGLGPGRIVRAVLRVAYNAGATPVIRPAIVVSYDPTDAPGICNLQIFTDGANDQALQGGRDQNVLWGPGYRFSETHEPGTWHWPGRN